MLVRVSRTVTARRHPPMRGRGSDLQGSMVDAEAACTQPGCGAACCIRKQRSIAGILIMVSTPESEHWVNCKDLGSTCTTPPGGLLQRCLVHITCNSELPRRGCRNGQVCGEGHLRRSELPHVQAVHADDTWHHGLTLSHVSSQPEHFPCKMCNYFSSQFGDITTQVDINSEQVSCPAWHLLLQRLGHLLGVHTLGGTLQQHPNEAHKEAVRGGAH